MRLLKSLLLLFCLSVVACAPRLPAGVTFELPQTGVYGQVLQAEAAAAGAWVYAYKNQQMNYRGPAEYAARVEADGRYTLDLLPGNWYLVGRFRPQGDIDGPPRVGDAWAIHPGNPVRVVAGQPQRIDFSLAAVSQPMLLRGGSLGSGDTGFTGRLLDAQDAAVAGAFVLAYTDLEFQRMPDHTSAAVDASGRFRLYVPQAGRYCLAARQRTRGQPIQGELYGTLGKGEAACRTVAAGQIIDVGAIRLTPYLR
ncbi:MAG TPA: hypothetical protein VIR78_01415 [Malonomonas sp.]